MVSIWFVLCTEIFKEENVNFISFIATHFAYNVFRGMKFHIASQMALFLYRMFLMHESLLK